MKIIFSLIIMLPFAIMTLAVVLDSIEEYKFNE